MLKNLAILIALALVTFAATPVFSDDEIDCSSGRCYHELLCHGDIALVGEPVNLVELTRYYFYLPPGASMSSAMGVHDAFPDRFAAFERQCNEERYALTPELTWTQDKKFMFASSRLVHIPAGQCSSEGQACHMDQHCCAASGAGMVAYCDLTSGSCGERVEP